MKIVDRKTFLSLPSGTIYARFRPDIFTGLEIKRETLYSPEDATALDWFYTSLLDNVAGEKPEAVDDAIDAARMKGASVPLDFDTLERDGGYDEEEMFGIYELDDILDLIGAIKGASTPEVKEKPFKLTPETCSPEEPGSKA